MASSDARVIYQHPLSYLLGLEGIALLRGYSGDYDREFTHARLREIQTLLDSAEELGEVRLVRRVVEARAAVEQDDRRPFTHRHSVGHELRAVDVDE